MVDIHVDPHADGIRCHDVIDIAGLIEGCLRVARARGQCPHDNGGPAALAAILRALPRELAVGISVVQHVDQFFAPGMAAWLSRESGLLVQVVKPQDQPGIGCVQLAATNDHLVLNAALAYEYMVEPKDLYFRPSVDVFFKSVVRHWPGPLVGVLLTGMGSDGAQGLLSTACQKRPWLWVLLWKSCHCPR